MNNAEKLVEVRNLKKYFKSPRGTVHAVDDVSFSVCRGRTMGVVGESGCGKSTLGRMLVHLEESTGGQILFGGEDITVLNRRDLRRFREHAQIIFQDPYSSLDARYTIEDSIKEPLLISGKYTRAEAQEKTTELMELVGIAPRLRASYPHELDGGRRQRVGIARALALDPEFIVCDEPVSALDVSIQAQVLNLLKELQEDRGLTYLFVTHDLSVVTHISDDICVMYLGQLVETSPSDELFRTPLSPLHQGAAERHSLDGHPPQNEAHPAARRDQLPIDPKPGCRFAARCPYACERCAEPQKLQCVAPEHYVACCRVREINGL